VKQCEQYISGPSRAELLFSLPALLRDPLGQFLDWNGRFGHTVSIPVRRPPTLHLSHPDDLRNILVTNAHRYEKTGALTIGRRLMGKGLLASREPLHTHQRQIAKPHFTRQAVDRLAAMMAETAAGRSSAWKGGTTIDIFPEMAHLTITIIGTACFSTDLSPVAGELYRDFGICQKYMQKLVYLPESWPIPGNIRYRRAVARIDTLVRRLIRERRGLRNRPDDLLTTLIEAKDVEGGPLSEDQVRDEMVNVLLAGHETTAIALAWTWYFLSLHPDIEQRMHDEVITALTDLPPTHDGIGRLTFTSMVLNESMRIRPPVWIIARVALEDDLLESGTRIPAGTEVLMMPYLAHRNPVHFPQPELFDPGRFSPSSDRRPSFTFLPFGAGPRGCIGEAFARMEALIILAVMGRRFSLRLAPGQTVSPEALVTLRPRNGILMRIMERTRGQQRDKTPAFSSGVTT